MLNPEALEAWLQAANERYRREEMPPRRRPFQAMSDYTREFNCSVAFGSPLATTVFDWFYGHSKPSSHAVGALFTGAFYFDACFWPLSIPMGYGTFTLNALESLDTMQPHLRKQLEQNRRDMWRLATYWADCCDYAYGIDDLRRLHTLDQRTLTFLENGDKELVGAIAQLVSPRPNDKAILSLRMTTEIFLKALLIQEKGLTDPELKKLSHRIEDVAEQCFLATKLTEFQVVARASKVFPEVSDRYTGTDRKLSDVWVALCVAQTAATTVTRHYTDRDMRPQLFTKPKEAP